MRKLVIGTSAAAALLLAGVLAWNAEATPLTRATTVPSGTNYSLVEKAGCWLPGLPGECDIGKHRVCNRFGNRCKCAPCPGWYPWREYKPAH
jgi:hypothetical protein